MINWPAFNQWQWGKFLSRIMKKRISSGIEKKNPVQPSLEIFALNKYLQCNRQKDTFMLYCVVFNDAACTRRFQLKSFFYDAFSQYYAIQNWQPTRIQESCCIFHGTTSNLPIMRGTYVALILLATVLIFYGTVKNSYAMLSCSLQRLVCTEKRKVTRWTVHVIPLERVA